ncbi:caspase family protein [Lentzea sp. NPDC055074]
MAREQAFRLPDPQRTRVLLIGMSTYDQADLHDLPMVPNNLQALKRALTDPMLGGLLPEHCRILLNPERVHHLLEAITRAASEAEDFLLVYFVGHGVLDDDAVLRLAVRETRSEYLRSTAVDLLDVKKAIRPRAKRRALVFDSCYSGQAVKRLLGPAEPLVRATSLFDGVYVVGSAGEYDPAAAPEHERFTVFTGELVDLLRAGVPEKPALLSLHTVFTEVQRRLASKGLPRPRLGSVDTVGGMALVRNAAAGSGGTELAPLPEQTPAVDTEQVVFPEAKGPGRLLAYLAAAAAAGGLLELLDRVQPPVQQVSASTFAACVSLWALCAFYVNIRMPAPYSLTVNRDVLSLRVGRKRHLVQWENIDKVELERRPNGSFDLRVRQSRSAIPVRTSRWKAGPRPSDDGDGFYMAEIRRLRARVEDVESALQRFGGAVWHRCPDIPTTPTPVRLRRTHFATKPRLLTALGVLLLLVGLSPFAALASHPNPWAAVPLSLISLPWCLPGVLVLRAAHRPATLELSTAGLRYRRGAHVLRLNWADVDLITAIGRLGPGFGPKFLYVRRRGSVDGRGELLCDVFSLCTSKDSIFKAIATTAGDRWQPGFRLDTEVRRDQNGTIFGGRTASARTAVAAALAAAVSATLLWALPLQEHPQNSSALWAPAGLFCNLLLLASLTGCSLLVRSRCTLTLDPTGITVQKGRRAAKLPWAQIRHIRVMKMQKVIRQKHRSPRVSTVNAIQVSLTSNQEKAPASWLFAPCFRRVNDIMMVCPVDALSFHLNASASTLDAELARFAGPQRWLPPVTHDRT